MAFSASDLVEIRKVIVGFSMLQAGHFKEELDKIEAATKRFLEQNTIAQTIEEALGLKDKYERMVAAHKTVVDSITQQQAAKEADLTARETAIAQREQDHVQTVNDHTANVQVARAQLAETQSGLAQAQAELTAGRAKLDADRQALQEHIQRVTDKETELNARLEKLRSL